MFSLDDPSTWPETSQVDPELVELIANEATPRYTRNGNDIHAIRKSWAKLAIKEAAQIVVAAEPEVDAGEIHVPIRDGTLRCLTYKPRTPPSAGSPLLVLIHGGAFAFGHAEFETLNAVQAARTYGCVAISMEYTLAPEAKYPVPVYECWDALNWIAANAPQLGADPSQGFLLGGCSAGGLIAAALVHLAQDEGLPAPLTGVLYSVAAFGNHEYLPQAYKSLHTSKSNASVALHPPAAERPYDVYTAIGPELRDPKWTIMNWPNGHGDHPPAYFQVCGLDALRDDALVMERELRVKWGVDTRVDMYAGMPHVFWLNYPAHSRCDSYAHDALVAVGWLLGRE